jgi:hypothetical protein
LMNQGLQQRWITAVSPEDIVENYGQLSYRKISIWRNYENKKRKSYTNT